MASKYSNERKSDISLTLNQNLKMMKLSKEGMSEVYVSCARQPGCECKGKFLKGN